MATTGPQNGRSLGVYVLNTLQAYSKSCSLSLKANSMDITSKDSNNWANALPTTKDWSITCEGLVAYNSSANAFKLTDLLIAGTKVIVKFKNNVSGDKYLWGQAYVTACDMNAGMDEPISYTATFQGTGVLTNSTLT